MTILLTVNFAEISGDCVNSVPSLPISLAQDKPPHYPKESKVSLTSEEMGIEANKRILASVSLNNN